MPEDPKVSSISEIRIILARAAAGARPWLAWDDRADVRVVFKGADWKRLHELAGAAANDYGLD